jgi:hypothetical protein
MANMVIPNEGKEVLLDLAIHDAGAALEDWSLDLYQNNYTPVDASTLADFTPSTFTGYVAVPITRAEMGGAAVVANVAERTRSVPPEFVCTGGTSQNAYGWFLTGEISGKVYAAQRFDTVRVMGPGATQTIDPFKFKLKTFA